MLVDPYIFLLAKILYICFSLDKNAFFAEIIVICSRKSFDGWTTEGFDQCLFVWYCCCWWWRRLRWWFWACWSVLISGNRRQRGRCGGRRLWSSSDGSSCRNGAAGRGCSCIQGLMEENLLAPSLSYFVQKGEDKFLLVSSFFP